MAHQANTPDSHNKNILNYVGRFAPSPTGPLHFGSLVAATASYLDAKAHHGKWLLRMEDLDPPREPAGAADHILQQLETLGFEWDGQVLYQSTRHEAYSTALATLIAKGLCFSCDCTRPRIQSLNAVYDGHCRDKRINHINELSLLSPNQGIRCQTNSKPIQFNDRIQGCVSQVIESYCGDFVIRRKDTLFSYQLAVTIDDDHQGITHVVRGWDLLDSTPRQIYLQQQLVLTPLKYAHIPIAADENGEKLSKQHFAAPVDTNSASDYLLLALRFLGLAVDGMESEKSPRKILDYGIEHWDIQRVPKLATIKGSWTL